MNVQYFFLLLICTSLTIDDVEHLFIYLFSNYACSFICTWVVFLLLSFHRPLGNLKNDLFRYAFCKIVFKSPSLWLIFSVLPVSFEEQKFLMLMKFSVSILSFVDHAFGVHSLDEYEWWESRCQYSCPVIPVLSVRLISNALCTVLSQITHSG